MPMRSDKVCTHAQGSPTHPVPLQYMNVVRLTAEAWEEAANWDHETRSTPGNAKAAPHRKRAEKISVLPHTLDTVFAAWGIAALEYQERGMQLRVVINLSLK